jgi:DNA-directed RNA polymerase subunit RPC12/RpoP
MTEEELYDDRGEDENEEQDSSDQQVRFNLEISPDRDHFLRRTCPSCGRDFKTEIDPADLAWALNTQIQRVSDEVGVSPAEIAQEGTPDNLRCPYCQHVAEASEVHTEETIEYLKRFAYRDHALPMINKMFSELEDSFGGGNRGGGGGFFSISISFKHERSVLPPRPIHGPEPADMKVIEFLCCGKKIKVADRWDDVSICTYCGAQVTLV